MQDCFFLRYLLEDEETICRMDTFICNILKALGIPSLFVSTNCYTVYSESGLSSIQVNDINQCSVHELKSLIKSNLGRAHDEETVKKAKKIVRKILDGQLDLGTGQKT